MRSMEIDRRRFLALLTAYAASPLAAQAASGKTSQIASMERGPLYLAARKHAGRFEAAVIDAQGREQLLIPMPDRGHSFAIDPARGRAVVFGRQPGFFAVAFDFDGKQPPQALQAAPERHFFGHGVFSPDGKIMVATENDYEAGHGVLGVYDASEHGAYRRIGEFLTAGIGPHEVLLMPDGRTLCVANGGILTHPDYGKLELNPDTMQPSLAYVDLHSGDLLEQVFLAPELHRLSIRHMVIDASGAIWFGCQYMGATQDRPPLVGRHRRGAQAELFAGPDETLRGMKNYVGSLAANAAGTVIATSSPVGGKVVFWNAASGNCIGETNIFDGCGVAPLADKGFIVSSGQGALMQSAPGADSTEIRGSNNNLAWDNHLRHI